MQSASDLIWKLIGALGGFTVVVLGLSTWLGKLWADRILEKDRQHYREELERLKSSYEAANKSIQSELDKRIHVYRVQFETEFKALSEIWGKITEVRGEMAGIRPVDSGQVDDDPGHDPMERYRPRLLRFSKILAELKILVFKYAPFYPEDIYERLWSLLTLAGKEEMEVMIACQRGTSPGPDWFVEGQKHLEEMIVQANGVSYAIRQRLQKLAFNE